MEADNQQPPITVERYLRMWETGVIDGDARVELIEGRIIDMPVPGPSHSAIVAYLHRLLVLSARDRFIMSQAPVRLGDISLPMPDVLLLEGGVEENRERHPIPQDTMLVVEVSDSTLREDMRVKVPLYARHGLAEVWVVDVRNQLVHVYRQPMDGVYQQQSVIKPPAVLRVPGLDGVQVELAKLFGTA